MRSTALLGLFFLLAGVGCFSVALTLAPEDDWRGPWLVVMFVLSAMCIYAFHAWELYTDTPMVPKTVWQNRSLVLVGCNLSLEQLLAVLSLS